MMFISVEVFTVWGVLAGALEGVKSLRILYQDHGQGQVAFADVIEDDSCQWAPRQELQHHGHNQGQGRRPAAAADAAQAARRGDAASSAAPVKTAAGVVAGGESQRPPV